MRAAYFRKMSIYEDLFLRQWVNRMGVWDHLYSYGHLPVISTYNPIYRMYNPIYNQL